MARSYRYRMLALAFAATTINYLDRSILGVLAPTLRDHVFGWTVADYSYVTVSFQVAYAIGMLTMGTVLDRVGVRRGYAATISLWTFFGAAHALIRPAFGLVGFMVARFGLGIGESGNPPCSAKVVAEWFPQRQRGLATGFINASTNLGAILAPIVVPLVVSADGRNWQAAFLITPVFSAIWVICWWRIYRPVATHPNVSAEERALIARETLPQTSRPVSWRAVAGCRETWAFALMKLPDAVWWFLLFWAGTFLADTYHLDLSHLGLPLMVVFITADLGSIIGGWLSGRLLALGWSVNRARKTTLLLCAITVLPVTLVTRVHHSWGAVVLLGLAAAGHQGWSTNIFTVVADLFPQKAIGSVIGMGGMVGSLCTTVAFLTLGQIIHKENPGSYFVPFLIAGLMYVAILGVVQLLVPTLKPVDHTRLDA